LVTDGEQVVDVPAKLAARVRVLSTGHGRKSDPDDAVSVAVAARSAPQLRQVGVEDQAVVLHLLTNRREDLVRMRTQTINRLHRLLVDLIQAAPAATSPPTAPPRCFARHAQPASLRSPATSSPPSSVASGIAGCGSGKGVPPAAKLGHDPQRRLQLGSDAGGVTARRSLIVQAGHPPIDDKGWRAIATGSAARSAAKSGRSRPAS
jgi:transposase